MTDGANQGGYRSFANWNQSDYPAYGGGFNHGGNITTINPRAAYQKSLMARAKANRDYRELARLRREYRTNMRAAGVMRLTPTVDANGYVGWGRYRKRGRRLRRRWRRRGYKGRGFYKGFFGDAGGFLGNAASRGLGIPGLGGVGRAAGNWLSGKVGFGAYEDANPTEDITGSVPLMMNVADKEGVITLTKREYIGDVISTNNTLQKLYELNLNPGDNNLCPWAADISRKFEKWRLISMIFHYVAHSGDTSSSIQLGRVMGCHLTDPLREAPSSVAEISQMNMSDLTAPCNSKTFGIECDGRLVNDDWKWIRRTPIQYTDINRQEETDHGRFFLFCDGIPGTNTNVGSLYVSYEIALLNPLHTGTADNYKTSATAYVDDGITAGSNYLLGPIPTLISNNSGPLQPNLGVSVTGVNGYYTTMLQFQSSAVGKFRVDIVLKDLTTQDKQAIMCVPLQWTATNLRMFKGFNFVGNGINDWGNSGPLQSYTAITGQEIARGSMKCFTNNPSGSNATNPLLDDTTTFTYFIEKFSSGPGTFYFDGVRVNGLNAGLPTNATELASRAYIQTAGGIERRMINVTRLPNDYVVY